MVRTWIIGIVIGAGLLGAGASWTQDAPRKAKEERAVSRQHIEVFTGDRIRLTHHDQSVTEGLLVSMNQLSLTLADTADLEDQRLIFFDSISEFEVARAGSTVSLKAYLVERSWLSFSEVARADTLVAGAESTTTNRRD